MKILFKMATVALVLLCSACEDTDTTDDDTRNTPETRDTHRDAERDTVHIGTEHDDGVEIRITE